MSLPRGLKPSLCALLAIVNFVLCLSTWMDRQYIQSVARSIAPEGTRDAELVEALCLFTRDRLWKNLESEVRQTPLPVRLNYLYNPFRPGPATILRYGVHHLGPCQSTSRVFAELCEARGLDSRIVYLHDSASLTGTHSLVEVNYAGVRGVVDPMFGIVFRHPDGRPATITDLRADPHLYRENALGGYQFIKQPNGTLARAVYPVDLYPCDMPLYFSFRRFGPLRWPVYNGLTALFGENGPLLLKRPRLIGRFPAIAALTVLDAAVLCALIIARVARRMHGRPPTRGPRAPIPAVIGSNQSSGQSLHATA